jgi:hypothetical protein
MTHAGDNRISFAETAHTMVDCALVAGSACARQPQNLRLANHNLYLLFIYDMGWYSRVFACFFGCYGISRLARLQAALEKRPFVKSAQPKSKPLCTIIHCGSNSLNLPGQGR